MSADKQLYRPIVATLGYVISPDGDSVLMMHRDTRKDDHHFGKYNGLGGKIRSDEDVLSCLRREIEDEAGITCEETRFAGTINWPGFGKDGEDWLGFIFRIERLSGNARTECAEGSLNWVPRTELLSLNLWEGDRFFLPLVFADPLRPFYGVMPYHGGKPLSWSYSLIAG